MFYPAIKFRFDSCIAISSVFVLLSSLLVSVCEMICQMGQSLLDVVSLSLAVFGKVSKRGGGIFLQGDSREKYLFCENSVGLLSGVYFVRYA